MTDRVEQHDVEMLADQQGTPAHPKPSGPEAIEHSKAHRPASDATQRNVWVGFFIGLAVLLVLGMVFAAR